MKDCTICNRQLCADPTTCRGELAALLARLDEPRERGERITDLWGTGWSLSVDEYRDRVAKVRAASIRQAEIRAGIITDDCDPHGIARPSLMVVPS